MKPFFSYASSSVLLLHVNASTTMNSASLYELLPPENQPTKKFAVSLKTISRQLRNLLCQTSKRDALALGS